MARPEIPDLDCEIGYTGAFPLISLGGVSYLDDFGQCKAELGSGYPANIMPPPAITSPTCDSMANVA